MAKTYTAGPGYEEKRYIKPLVLKNGFRQTIQHDIDKFGAEQALNTYNAFYKVRRLLKYRLENH